MKFRSLIFVLLLCRAGVSAQNPYVAVEGAFESAEGVSVSDPRTVLAVDVEVECDRTLAGPYARYAQKYLGVRAPMSDKTLWSVRGASVSLLDDRMLYGAAAPAAPEQRTVDYAVSDDEFARIQPDKLSTSVRSPEDAARDAANTIFSLRRHRLELITGEAGENVFGEGLQAALDEIARLEQCYLELFLGKRVLVSETRRYVVYPQSAKKQYIVCRFNSVDGLLPESDLSGDMVLLQIDPSYSVSDLAASPKEQSFVKCRLADLCTCTVICAGRECARAVLPLFEFGQTVKVALPRHK
ncbi:MAG: DUF4831 family protein [Alistipes sp.]|nr:DUF4831 family protein [Alistipes senegalensis]MCM1250104.1 DUF4831 family protein [Alistipes sp.]